MRGKYKPTRAYKFRVRSRNLDISLLRQTWNLIEATNAGELLEISESELVGRLVKRLEATKPLEKKERDCVNKYLHAKINLIRDTAESRRVMA